MDIVLETYKILALRKFKYFDSKMLVDWAVLLLQNGYDSESLTILAGLDNEQTEVRENYFWNSIQELDLNLNKTESEIIDVYAKDIAKKVIEGKLNPIKGLSIMSEIVVLSDYSGKYIHFYEVEDDISNLKHDNSTIFNHNLNHNNINSFLIKEFQLFLEMEQLHIKDEIRNSSICQNCNSIQETTLKTKKNFFGKPKYNYWVCSNCGSNDVISFRTQIGREMIINRIKTQPNNG